MKRYNLKAFKWTAKIGEIRTERKNWIRQQSGEKPWTATANGGPSWTRLTLDGCHNMTHDGLYDHKLDGWNGLNWRPDELDCQTCHPTNRRMRCPNPRDGDPRTVIGNLKQKIVLTRRAKKCSKKFTKRELRTKDQNCSSAGPRKRRIRH